MNAGPAARPRGRLRGPLPDPRQRAARLRERLPREFRPHFDVGGPDALKRTGWSIARQLRDLTGEQMHIRMGGKSGEPRITNPRLLKGRRHLLAQRMAPVLDKYPHLLVSFNVGTSYELAHLVLEMELSLRRGIGARTTSELAARGSARTGGLFGDVVGRLLEVVANQHKVLHAQLRQDAAAVLARVQARGKPVKTLGGGVVTPGEVTLPDLVTKMFTVVRDDKGKIVARDEFVDFGYGSWVTPKEAQPDELRDFFALPGMGDVKVPGQIRKAGKKFRNSLGRLGSCTELEMQVEGRLIPVRVPRERILDLPDDVTFAIASTAEGQKGPGYVRRFTRADGFVFEVPVLGVDVEMAALYEMARLILHR